MYGYFVTQCAGWMIFYRGMMEVQYLKVMTNEKQRKSGMWPMIHVGTLGSNNGDLDGCFFLFKFGRHPRKYIFPFLLTPAALIVDFLTNSVDKELQTRTLAGESGNTIMLFLKVHKNENFFGFDF
jgi:hypothetical protein